MKEEFEVVENNNKTLFDQLSRISPQSVTENGADTEEKDANEDDATNEHDFKLTLVSRSTRSIYFLARAACYTVPGQTMDRSGQDSNEIHF